MRVLVGGSSGLIGRALVESLRADGHDVLRLVRRGSTAPDERAWDPGTPLPDDALTGVDAIVHLGGMPLLSGPWTARRRETFRTSRIDSTATLARAIADAVERGPAPSVFVVASAIGIYGDCGDNLMDEDSERGVGFLADLVADWEAASTPARDAGVRTVHARFGLILSKSGGMLAKLLPSFRVGLGARLGSGRQWMSWATRADAVRALRFAIDNPVLSGPMNVVAGAATNAEFTRAVGRAVRRPAPFVAPAWLLKLAAGMLAREALLPGQHVSSNRLLSAGFQFDEADLGEALARRV